MTRLFISAILKKPSAGGRGGYPFSLPAVRSLSKLSLSAPVTFFVGENGTGKSTLLEAIAVNSGFNAEGGSRNFNFSTVQTHSGLYEHITLIKGPYRPKDGFFLRAESFYNVSSEIERLSEDGLEPPDVYFKSYGGRSPHQQSHGESFLALVNDRFWGEGLYILDEPESALSPMRQLALLRRMSDLVQGGSQFIIATHSPILMAYPGAAIYVLTESGIELTPYRETEHYVITKEFLNNPNRMLGHLFED